MYPTGLIPAKLADKDNRDLLYSTLFKVNRKADRAVRDPRGIKNQKKFGTCTAFGATTATETIFREELSPLFVYRNAKLYFCPYGMNEQGTTGKVTMKSLIEMGNVEESKYPYSNYKEPMVFPDISEAIVAEGKKNRIEAYAVIDTRNREQAIAEIVDHLLHDNGGLLIAGMTVGLTSYFNPEELWNGDAVIDVPYGNIAGHMMALVEIDCNMTYTYKTGHNKGKTRKGFVKCVQSYGTAENRESEFGDGTEKIYTKTGFVWLPFDYLFGGYDPMGDGSAMASFVNELFVPLKNIPFNINKIDGGDQNIKPYLKNSRTLVPLRFIGEALGLQVEFKESNRSISITGEGRSVKLTVGSNVMVVNGKQVNIDVAPEIKDSRTFVPLRAISEAFNADVEYFEYEQRIEIKKDDLILELWIGRNEARRIKRL